MMKTNIERVLIANRGAIAVRIIRTLQAMGIESVAIYAEADRESLHVRQADHAYSLGEGGATDTYLDQQKIISIAQQAQANAIHPGYGFLSENTNFVTLCEDSGFIFLGPSIEQMEAFGLKHRARELAEKSGVPLLPGSSILTDCDAALKFAALIGYPVMLKSTAGGGGIGMQLCNDVTELSNAWTSVSALSKNNFSNADLFIEKFVAQARHIEVQIFGDGSGNAIAIGERDCSAQRRNQKVIEETPAPNLSDKVRQNLQQVAVTLAESVNYRSAGTVEFILDAQSQEFYFLEVNTRLQVEHGVTEEVYGIDLVHWMIDLANGNLTNLTELAASIQPTGHAIQARIYAEDPNRNFQPSAGLLSSVDFPATVNNKLRIDTWIEAGIEVSPFFDPMLAKVICYENDRASALFSLHSVLENSKIYGIETNLNYLAQLLKHPPIQQGQYLTATLASFSAAARSLEVLSPGTMTTIQDYPGRIGYWDIGVPPSGPFDNVSFQFGNQLLGNNPTAAGLEMTINGAHLRFSCDCDIILTGAVMSALLDSKPIQFWQVVSVKADQELKIGKTTQQGARAYLLISGGLDCPTYLGSCATFTLGQFGGHAGRALRTGDILHINVPHIEPKPIINVTDNSLVAQLNQQATDSIWLINVIAGPQSAPDYFTEEYIELFFKTDWEVHYNSSRTGVRLIGPKPEWARSDGGEAGMHPSNIHDNAYAIGAIDFTGDMPVILGPDGPSLGGFVCPATVISADLWKLGQLKAGDKVRFISVNSDMAVAALSKQQEQIKKIQIVGNEQLEKKSITITQHATVEQIEIADLLLTFRQSGDRYLLIEFGLQTLDIELRFLVHRLMLAIQERAINGVQELTPGIRSLQIHYDCLALNYGELLSIVKNIADQIANTPTNSVASRIIHLPLSWDDEQCQLAIEKYHQSVRKDAPWYPSNIEFIRRINGLESIEDVKKIVFDASYLVMGLGDVYLGAPVATPVDPRHRLVTTKYNPARTWTAENCVGIGGSYMCIYGMEGPGGYQFVGRTLQMWNRYRLTAEFEQPWLLRFFDQIRFYPVSSEELQQIRKDFPLGQYPIKIEQTSFNLDEYKANLVDNQTQIDQFTQQRVNAFDNELAQWQADGQLHFEQSSELADVEENIIPEGMIAIESPVAGNIWQVNFQIDDRVNANDCLLVLESMKMEIEVNTFKTGKVHSMLHKTGEQVAAGSLLAIIDPD